MKNFKKTIEAWSTGIIIQAVAKAIAVAPIENRVAAEIEKLRYDYLPHGACWMCSMPVSRKGGYQMWQGKMFCTDACLHKYAGLMQKPDENFKYIQGHPVEIFHAQSI